MNPIMIKLSLENMKKQIVFAMSEYSTQIGEQVEAHMNNIIKDFDFEKAVRGVMNEVIDDAIKHYFKDGDGRKIITEAISESISESLNSVFRVKVSKN